ncbi:MAG: hypothetical protein HYZ28_22485 [Myxococcales bacterium]|nr:hypothetical protein [Myxococcales bacterium]
MRALEAVRISLATVALAGCGYRFAAGGAPLPEGIRSVWAPIFENHTAEPGVEAIFTQAFRERLIRAGVDGEPSSEARVEGQLLSISAAGTIFSPSQRLASYRLTASAVLKLKKGERVLSEAQVTGSEDYLPGADALHSEANRMAALHRLAEAMMKDAYARLASGW